MRQREEAGGEDGRRERGTVMGGWVREREREGGRNETPVNDNIPSPRYRFFAAFVALLDATTARG